MNANGNGVLTLDEMMTTAAHLTTVEVKAIQNEFEELDKVAIMYCMKLNL